MYFYYYHLYVFLFSIGLTYNWLWKKIEQKYAKFGSQHSLKKSNAQKMIKKKVKKKNPPFLLCLDSY